MATSHPYRELLGRAGFTDVAETDYTPEFAHVARAWIDQWDEHGDVLEREIGVAGFVQRQAERRIQLRAVEDGLLRRSLLVARRPEVPGAHGRALASMPSHS